MIEAKKIVVSLFALAAALFLVFSYAETFQLQTNQTEIDNPAVPARFEGMKLVFAADFHCGMFLSAGRLSGIVEKINRLNPNIVILGGDYVDRGNPDFIIPCMAELGKIKAPLGVYGVLGNHDSGARQKEIIAALQNNGINILDNRAVWVRIADQKIMIAGVADALTGRPQTAGFIGDLEDDDFAVLASHNPLFTARLPAGKIDLMLAGHVHGGQLTFFGQPLPFYSWRYGNKLMKGESKQDGTTILVSRGIGATVMPLRFFAPPEINVIVLHN